ncbi:MAG: DMT family transporter [Gammaproteobacteria bacterium]|nr:DMT family transporter [Gammaproteobacteria bacterium]
MSTLSDYQRGLLLTVLGVLILCFDTPTFRLAGDIEPWTAVFWRSGLTFVVPVVILLISPWRAWLHPKQFTRALLLITLCYTFSAIGFINAITHTSIANTLFILALMPIFTSLLAWVFLKEAPTLSLWLTSAVCLVGISLVVGGISPGVGYEGELWGLLAAMSMSLSFILGRGRKENLSLAPIFAGGLAALVGFALADNVTLQPSQMPYMLINGGLIIPIAFALIVAGPRHLPAAQVGLIMLLETALGPVLVWWWVGESLDRSQLIGGAVILAALFVYYAMAFRSEQTRPGVA